MSQIHHFHSHHLMDYVGEESRDEYIERYFHSLSPVFESSSNSSNNYNQMNTSTTTTIKNNEAKKEYKIKLIVWDLFRLSSHEQLMSLATVLEQAKLVVESYNKCTDDDDEHHRQSVDNAKTILMDASFDGFMPTDANSSLCKAVRTMLRDAAEDVACIQWKDRLCMSSFKGTSDNIIKYLQIRLNHIHSVDTLLLMRQQQRRPDGSIIHYRRSKSL